MPGTFHDNVQQKLAGIRAGWHFFVLLALGIVASAQDPHAAHRVAPPVPAEFTAERRPLQPESWPTWDAPPIRFS